MAEVLVNLWALTLKVKGVHLCKRVLIAGVLLLKKKRPTGCRNKKGRNKKLKWAGLSWEDLLFAIFLFLFDVSGSSCSFKTRKMVMLVHRRHNNTDPSPPTAVLQII